MIILLVAGYSIRTMWDSVVELPPSEQRVDSSAQVQPSKAEQAAVTKLVQATPVSGATQTPITDNASSDNITADTPKRNAEDDSGAADKLHARESAKIPGIEIESDAFVDQRMPRFYLNLVVEMIRQVGYTCDSVAYAEISPNTKFVGVGCDQQTKGRRQISSANGRPPSSQWCRREERSRTVSAGSRLKLHYAPYTRAMHRSY